MTLLELAVLALVQGLTEFLPVSSSAHLILVSHVFNWEDQGLELDVAVHVGTLLAVLFYFRHELLAMLRAWFGAPDDPETLQRRRLSLALAIATVPVVLVGAVFYASIAGSMRDVRVIAIATLVFGVLLLAADRLSPRSRELKELRLVDGLWIGLAQVLALIPGASRSGVTMTMGRFLGFTSEDAARFSFLLSIPVIAAAGIRGAWAVAMQGSALAWQEFLVATALAAVAGWACIAVFLALLKRLGLLPFIVYRIALGLLLLGIAF